MALPLVTNAAVQYVTNNVGSPPSEYAELYNGSYNIYIQMHGTNSLGVFNFSDTVTADEFFVTYTQMTEEGTTQETFSFVPPQDMSSQSYTFNLSEIQFSGGQNGITPLIVPEPQPFVIFMLGFGLVFGTGMLATGARWIRQVIIGETETL